MPSLKLNGKRLCGGGSKWLTPRRRASIYQRDGYRCVYCKKNLSNEPRSQVTLDHVVPVIAGGTHASSNLVTSCKRCNDQKQHRRSPLKNDGIPQLELKNEREHLTEKEEQLAKLMMTWLDLREEHGALSTKTLDAVGEYQKFSKENPEASQSFWSKIRDHAKQPTVAQAKRNHHRRSDA